MDEEEFSEFNNEHILHLNLELVKERDEKE